MYYVMRASAPSLHRESTDSLINRTLSSVPHFIKTSEFLVPSHIIQMYNVQYMYCDNMWVYVNPPALGSPY